jgi:hypothetical protein
LLEIDDDDSRSESSSKTDEDEDCSSGPSPLHSSNSDASSQCSSSSVISDTVSQRGSNNVHTQLCFISQDSDIVETVKPAPQPVRKGNNAQAKAASTSGKNGRGPNARYVEVVCSGKSQKGKANQETEGTWYRRYGSHHNNTTSNNNDNNNPGSSNNSYSSHSKFNRRRKNHNSASRRDSQFADR